MTSDLTNPLPDPPRGFRYYRSRQDILHASELFAYQHMLLRAWEEMNLSGILTLDGIPTVYVQNSPKPVAAREAAQIQSRFWNQGIATILLLRDPQTIRIFSSMTVPVAPDSATEDDIEARLVDSIDLATQASWADRLEKLYLSIGTGTFYRTHESKFNPNLAVDSYLMENLAAVRDELVGLDLQPSLAHAFLGRLLFTCYLCDRGILVLKHHFPGNSWKHLHELLAGADDAHAALYDIVFPKLRHDFNSSMFDDDLDTERDKIEPRHLDVIQRFLQGDEISKKRGQRSLGFWAYDFNFIPVETISAIYENFLEGEDGKGKHASGAFYTPRFLAEMTLDLALEGSGALYEKDRRYIDPSCGSGIFLVLLFNRLAAEWRASQKGETTPQAKADALLDRMNTLRGIDKNVTACRIACFSLYLAFLDQFDPPDIQQYKLQSNKKKLPNLLRFKEARGTPEHPVVWEGDFFDLAPKWQGQFDLVIGNPPWAKRDTQNAVHFQFMKQTPGLLKETGRACLLLPSKVFLNQTDAFQSRWLKEVTLEKLVQLADYRKILFKEAKCPCNIVLFTPQAPDVATHEIEYIAPKVSLSDLRDGVIPVAPHDHKWIPLRYVLAATEQKASAVAWKSQLWGTARDAKLLDYLFTFPRLDDLTGTVSEMQRGKKRWCKGQGFQAMRPNQDVDEPKLLQWSNTDSFVDPKMVGELFSFPKSLAMELGIYLEQKGYLLNQLRRLPSDKIFEPPLVLLNQGFTSTAFFDYTVRFQDSFQSLAGPVEDTNALLFLTAYLRSKLARYIVFQTAANIGTERDKVHMFEVLRLPFFLPDSESAQPNAASIVEKISSNVRNAKEKLEKTSTKFLEKLTSKVFQLQSEDEGNNAKQTTKWLQTQRQEAAKLQKELEQHIYDYFGLNEQERALVEDTCDIFDRSDTPGSLADAQKIPTLQPLESEELTPYAAVLSDTLNGWATGALRTSASGGVDAETGLALIELAQTREPQLFRTRNISKQLATSLKRLQDISAEKSGPFLFQRSGWYFDGPRIYLVKPALLGQWTRTAALNDAAEIHAHISEARRLAKTA